MIKVKYQGTLGNQLWQYVVGRNLAERDSRKLVADPIPGFPSTFEPVSGGSKGFARRRTLLTGHSIPEKLPTNRIVLKGYFQRYEYLWNLRENIRWASPDYSPRFSPDSDDLVLSVRRGWNGWPTTLCPPPEYYLELLGFLNFPRTWILTDSPDDPWFEKLVTAGAQTQFYRGSPIDQFTFVSQARYVVMAPSTFTWWAAFVGRAEKIFWPNIPALERQPSGADWFPVGDKRYVIV